MGVGVCNGDNNRKAAVMRVNVVNKIEPDVCHKVFPMEIQSEVVDREGWVEIQYWVELTAEELLALVLPDTVSWVIMVLDGQVTIEYSIEEEL